MWSRRAQEYEAKISSGKIYELAEVVRDLNKGDDLLIDQSYSERQLFEKAYERLLAEFKIVYGASIEDTQKKMDKALKRNLEAQKAKPEKNKEIHHRNDEEGRFSGGFLRPASRCMVPHSQADTIRRPHGRGSAGSCRSAREHDLLC